MGLKRESDTCIRVAVALPVRETFHYLVPEDLAERVQVGSSVHVPFGNRRVTGYVLEWASTEGGREMKSILEPVDSEPLFSAEQVPFFEWIADYYLHPIGQVIRAALPGGVSPTTYRYASLTEAGRRVVGKLPQASEEKEVLEWILKHSGRRLRLPSHKVSGLEKKGWICVEEKRKRARTGPLLRKFLQPAEGVTREQALAQLPPSLGPENEAAFLTEVFTSGTLLLSEVTAKFPNGRYLADKWTRRGVLSVGSAPVYRDPAGKVISPSPPPPRLYEQQEAGLRHIRASLDRGDFHVSLLFGVTGSGKTEVYFGAVAHAIRLGRRAILMVPEIALAVYVEGLFRSRLGNRVAVYHSGLSEGERYDEWMRMKRGEVDLVIGARSALFSPLPDLGLIIVDEEHDASYKQDTAPRHNARDGALVRGKMQGAVVVLGSGTPSLQSYQNCLEGRYALLNMPERVDKRPLPEIELIDMKRSDKAEGEDEMLSPRLTQCLEEDLASGSQALLFLNRRGFHRLYLCRSCGQTLRCPNCDVALTYHLREDFLTCHYCGYACSSTTGCPSCRGDRLRAYGFGTEKLELEIGKRFPGARVARMDTDSIRRKGQVYHILKKFSDREIDILVGTQMITKGYDFPGVTLVGVISADLSLDFPDFRAGERTFQLLAQVAGRAGRGAHRGRVVIQTFNPGHYAVMAAMAHDYEGFFGQEKALREQLGYPPFAHLASLRLQGNSPEGTSREAQRLGEGLRHILSGWPKRGKEIQVLGPVEAAISRLKGKYRWQILIKSRRARLLNHLLREVEGTSRRLLRGTGVQLIVDVDPYQLL